MISSESLIAAIWRPCLGLLFVIKGSPVFWKHFPACVQRHLGKSQWGELRLRRQSKGHVHAFRAGLSTEA